VDGIVGPKTIAALKAVQAQYGLPPSEKLDAAGLATLLPLLLTAGQSE
jgi:peptidoglycan hydrolase-like protein with peptidoglycan-binding domain